MTDLIIEVTPRGRRQQALQLLRLDSARIERLLAAAHCGHIDMQGLVHARRGDTLVGAAWGQVTPGRAAFCWPAQIAAGEPEATADRLQEAVDERLGMVGVALSQALLSPRDIRAAMRLTRAGYRHLADLDYLASSIEQFPTQPPSRDLTYVPMVAPGTEQRVQRVIERTYEHTLDCTNLDRARSIDDVLVGYRRTGVFRPHWWILAQHRGVDVGCLLLADHPEHEQCELMYLGIVPEFRGRRWGQELTRYAQWMARCEQRQQIVLAVDDANWPARELYARSGFHVWDRRSVYVRTAHSDGTRIPS